MNAVEKIEPQGAVSNLPALSETAAVLGMIERAARDPSVDMSKMMQLMSWRKEMVEEQRRAAFDEAIAKAKSEIKPVVRNATGHNSKKYADFAAISAAVDPVLGRNGLSYRFETNQSDKAITTTCILFGHGHSIPAATLTAPADMTGNKNAIQAIGSTLTYLQRYSLMQALGLAAANDDDGKSGGNVETVTQKQADDLSDLIEANGKNRAQFLKWAKVERFEDIPATAYDACVKAIEYKAPAK